MVGIYRVRSNSTITELKEQLQVACGAPASETRLAANDTLLDDKATLRECGIVNHDTLSVFFMSAVRFTIRLVTLSGAEQRHLVTPSTDVEELKDAMRTSAGMDPATYSIWFPVPQSTAQARPANDLDWWRRESSQLREEQKAALLAKPLIRIVDALDVGARAQLGVENLHKVEVTAFLIPSESEQATPPSTPVEEATKSDGHGAHSGILDPQLYQALLMPRHWRTEYRKARRGWRTLSWTRDTPQAGSVSVLRQSQQAAMQNNRSATGSSSRSPVRVRLGHVDRSHHIRLPLSAAHDSGRRSKRTDIRV